MYSTPSASRQRTSTSAAVGASATGASVAVESVFWVFSVSVELMTAIPQHPLSVLRENPSPPNTSEGTC